jgi:hypothetical protein
VAIGRPDRGDDPTNMRSVLRSGLLDVLSASVFLASSAATVQWASSGCAFQLRYTCSGLRELNPLLAVDLGYTPRG